MALSGKQYRELQETLLDAFPAQSDLAQMVRYGLSVNLNAVSMGNDLAQIVFQLIQWAEARGRTYELIVAAREANPSNPKLRLFAEQLALAPVSPPLGEVERIVLKSVQFKNVEQWRQRLSECELTVCRVEIPTDTGMGTGFLLGPDLVMTNYHVMQDVIANPGLRDGVALRFDYKTQADGATLRPGEVFRLASDWLVDSSPVADLDYALLRVADAPGQNSVGGQQGAPPRGWLRPEAHKFEMGSPIFIIQHPKAAPLKLASGSVLQVTEVPSRVRYNTNTETGSSGSPCFTNDWQLVALHHYGDPTGNEGIPFSAILTRPKIKEALGL